MTEQQIDASTGEIEGLEAFIRQHNATVQAEQQAQAQLATAFKLWRSAKGLPDETVLVGTDDAGHVRVMVPEEKKDTQ